MKNISIMIKPASSLCNLRCAYCFYMDVSNKRKDCSLGIMKRETVNLIIGNIFSALGEKDRVSFVFQGGEPTLAGLDFFKYFVSEVSKRKNRVRVSYALQTNGICLDDKWCVFLKNNEFLVGLSMDIIPQIHDADRVDTSGRGTFSRVTLARDLLEKHGVEYNVLTVLTDELSKYPLKVWEYICKEDIKYTQFVPCLGELNGKTSKYQLRPQNFANFYIELFYLWLEDFKSGKYRSIKLFDDLINLLFYGRQTACGITGKCQPQIVLEADGRAFPCDFYALDEFCIGDMTAESLESIYMRASSCFHMNADNEPEICSDCKYVSICHGGCKRMRVEVYEPVASDSCGYHDFLSVFIPGISLLISYGRVNIKQLH